VFLQNGTTMTRRILSSVALICWSITINAADAPSIDPLLEHVRSYQLGKDRRPLEQLEALAAQSVKNPEQRKEIASKLAALLPSEMSFEGKDFILRTLYLMGTPAEIPAVAKLLPDEKFSHMSRYVLESMATPQATAAIREALPAAKGRPLLGIVNSLGNLRDIQSIQPLAAMLKSEDEQLASAAAGALGRIGTPEAAKALSSVDTPARARVNDAIADAKIRCADQLLADGKSQDAIAIYESCRKSESVPVPVRIAAARGLVKARGEAAVPIVVEMLKSEDRQTMVMGGGLARQLRGGNSAVALADAIPSLKPEAQEVLIAALADRGDAAARQPIVALVTSPEQSVRVAALRALASIGDASDVPMLLDKASKGENRERDAARLALSRIRGNEVNNAILKGISPEPDAGDRSVEAVRALASRAATEHVPTLVDLAKTSKSEPVRGAAITALGNLTEQKDYAALIELLTAAQNDGERDAAKSALAAAAVRLDAIDASAQAIASAAQSAPPAAKAQLLEALSRVGGPKALESLRSHLKDNDPTVADAAVRALGQWRDGAVIPDLLRLIESNKQTHRVLALRGLSRLLEMQENRRSADVMLDVCRKMMTGADRPEEKRLVLGRVGEIRDARALELATPYLKDAALRNEAATAILTITRSIKQQMDKAKEAVQKVESTPEISESLKNQAKELLK
jgi:HEAT repeat protein